MLKMIICSDVTIFNTWSPISPIPICYEPNSPSMNDTYVHTPNNHVLNELPQNLTIMNDTYIPYNFHKPNYYK